MLLRRCVLLRPALSTARPRSQSSAPARQPAEPLVQDEKFDFEDLKVLEKSERRKPPIPPFMKDCFVSIYNRDLLAFPEILNKEESDALDQRVKILEDIFNSEKTEAEKEEEIKRTKIFGAPIALTSGGYALNVTERLRYLETLSANISLSKVISDHWVGLGALKVGLPQVQYDKIVSDFIYGDNVIALCTKETISTRVNQSDLRSTAKLTTDNVWCIQGEKLCRNADSYMLAMCLYEETRLRGFLVHPGAAGVTTKEPCVHFHDTPATALTEISEDALTSALSLSRLDTAVMAYSLLKRMINEIIHYTRGKYVSGQPLADLPLIRTKVADALLTVYAAESMAYFTAGLLDGYYGPDAELEIAMCRTYITEHGLNCVIGLLNILGMEGMSEDFVHFLNEFRQLQLKDEHNDSLNLYIALSGLHHAGMNLAQDVKQMRNPLFHPSFILKKIFSNRHQEHDNPTLTLYLYEHLHPSMQNAANNLEYSVLRLKYASELLLARHGADIFTKHTELERLAKAATEVLAMTSVLARASRSYCIGLRNAEEEMRFSATIVEISKSRVKRLIRDIDEGEYLNLDQFNVAFGRKVLDTGTLLVEKPTARVWW